MGKLIFNKKNKKCQIKMDQWEWTAEAVVTGLKPPSEIAKVLCSVIDLMNSDNREDLNVLAWNLSTHVWMPSTLLGGIPLLNSCLELTKENWILTVSFLSTDATSRDWN